MITCSLYLPKNSYDLIFFKSLVSSFLEIINDKHQSRYDLSLLKIIDEKDSKIVRWGFESDEELEASSIIHSYQFYFKENLCFELSALLQKKKSILFEMQIGSIDFKDSLFINSL